MDRHSNERNQSLKMKHKHNRKDKQRYHNGLAQKQLSSVNGLSAGRSIKSGDQGNITGSKDNHIPTLSFVRQIKDRKINVASTPGSNLISLGSTGHKHSETARSKIRRSTHRPKEHEVNDGQKSFEHPSRSPVASVSPVRPSSVKERDSNRKISYSHTEMLKSLYVGEKKGSTAAQRVPSDKRVASKSTERQRVNHNLPKSHSHSGVPTVGRVHKSTATPFQRNSRPINKINVNTSGTTPSVIKFAFETTLNEIDLNLLTRARASSGGHSTSNGSTNDPITTTKKNMAEVQNKVADVIHREDTSKSSNPSKANDKTHVPGIVNETKELSSMLSSRLKMRNVLFDKKETPEVEIKDVDTKKDQFIKKEQCQAESVSTTTVHKSKNTRSMNLPSMQSIITGLGRLASRTENLQTPSGIPDKSGTFTKNQSTPRDLAEISKAKKGSITPIVETPEKRIPQLDLTSPSFVSTQASIKNPDEMAAAPDISVTSATSAASATKDPNDLISESTEPPPTVQKTNEENTSHLELNAHGEPTLQLTEANVSKITEKDDIELHSKPNTFAHFKEDSPTEEATVLVALSDSSSEKSSDGSSSGQYVGDFQLLNSMKTRMVGPKLGKWRNINKSKLMDLMNYLVVEHTAFAERADVSCSNDICNIRNYEEVEIHHLQKLPPRLQYLDLQSSTNGNVTKPAKADRRVEKLRKNELFNGSVQKRRTRASVIDSEGGKKILQEQQIEDRVPCFNFDTIPQETILSTPSKVQNYKPSKTTQDVDMLPTLVSSPDNGKSDANTVLDYAITIKEINTQTESPEVITEDSKDVEENVTKSMKDLTTNNLENNITEPNQPTQHTPNIDFDPEKCEDLAQFRKEYLKLRALKSEDSPLTSLLGSTSATQEYVDQKKVIENLTNEIIKSELKIASLVGMNNELHQKINEMENLQTKLIHELNHVPIKSQQTLRGEKPEVTEINERKGWEITNKKQPIEETSPSAHRKLVNKVEKDLVEIEALNKVVTERLAEIKAIKDRKVEDHPLIKQLKDTLEAERARSKTQLSLERQRVSNLKAALLSKNGKIAICDHFSPSVSLHGRTIEELDTELLHTREYAQVQQKANKTLQLQCASYQHELSEAAIKCNELSSKVVLASEQCGQLNVVNNRLISKLKQLNEQHSIRMYSSSADGNLGDVSTDLKIQGNATYKQHLYEQSNQAQIPKSNSESKEENEGVNRLLKEDLKKLSDKVSSLQLELKALKQLENNIIPLSTFCRQENLSVRNVIDRLQWVKKLELTIFTMFNDKKMLMAKLGEIERILNENEQTIRDHKDSLVNLEKTNEIRCTSEDSIGLNGIVIRLLEERKKLKSILQNQTEQKDHDGV